MARVYMDNSESPNPQLFVDFVDFKVVEVPEEDRELIRLGAIFNWHVGQKFKPHSRLLNGQIENTSIIVFRMMPVWKNYLDKANEKADELAKIMGWSDSS